MIYVILKNIMKKKIVLSIGLLLCELFVFAQTATITLTTEKQVIRGFGGINHPEWYTDLNAAERQLAYGNGPGQLGFTVLRTYVSDNPANFGRGIETARYAYGQGAYVFASPWNPPSAMREVFGTNSDGTSKYRLKYSEYANYAKHLNDYVTYMKNQGVNLYAISTQNEPDYAHDWTWWTPTESVNFIKNNGPSINCKLMTPESFQYLKNVYDPILNDPAALANVSVFGTHLYGTQYKDFPYPLFEQKGAGKELWMTEVYTDSKYDGNIWSDTYINDDRHAIKVAEHIHYAMVEGNFQTYVFWPLRRYYALIHDGNSDGQGNTPAAAGTATKRGYCMAQFSKFVRPGYVRVDATKIPSTNVFLSAYKNGNDVVIVVVNKNTATRTITINIPGTPITTWEQYTTSATKNIAQGSNITGGTSFQVTLDAASVTTFVGKAPQGAPIVTLTSPTANQTFTAPATVSIAATATAGTGKTISKVEFYNGTTKLGEDATSPYTYSWTNVAAGTYTLTAVATDNAGNKTTSASVVIKVNVPKGPYGGTAPNIPGKIEFENFDVGGNGVGYLDNTPGTSVPSPPAFRTDEDVDIETCTDAGGGYNIGYATAGEWLEYSVNVVRAGTYTLTLRVACQGDGRTLSVAANGVTIANNVAIPNTGGWQTWQDVVIPNITLTAGAQVIRVTIGATDYINLNYMTFTAATTPAPTVTTPVTYCQGATATALTATGTALKWYTVATGGTASTTAPTPSTATAGSTIYYVSQTVNNVESSRSSIIVTINATPIAPVVNSPIEYTLLSQASPLTATGTNLRWYSTTTGGTASAIAPTPSTATAGTTYFYVSQMVGSCESPRATIAVVVSVPKVTLSPGWNMIGCPLQGTTNMQQALSSIWSQVETVKDQDSFWDIKNVPALNSLSTVTWGKGYLVKVKTACTLDWIVR